MIAAAIAWLMQRLAPLLGIALVAALAWGAWQTFALSGARLEAAQAHQALSDYVAASEKQARAAADELAAETIRVSTAQRGALDAAAQKIDALAADRDRAAGTARSLRDRAATLAAACVPSPVAAVSAASSPSAPSPGTVLADMLGRVDDAAGRYAELADRARIAGQLCEASYDALRH